MRFAERCDGLERQQASAWRTTPQGLARLVAGLWLFGVGAALIIAADLGVDPWTVLAQGLTNILPVSIGVMTIIVGAGVLALWLPLRERPGLATVLNVVLIGVSIDVTLAMVPEIAGLVPRVALVFAGIATIGVGSGLYLGERLGSGPRDGLMTGLHRRTGAPVWKIRTAIEISVLAVGAVLGGTVGFGTAAFALLVGPAVDAGLWLRGDDRARRPRKRRGVDEPARSPA